MLNKNNNGSGRQGILSGASSEMPTIKADETFQAPKNRGKNKKLQEAHAKATANAGKEGSDALQQGAKMLGAGLAKKFGGGKDAAAGATKGASSGTVTSGAASSGGGASNPNTKNLLGGKLRGALFG